MKFGVSVPVVPRPDQLAATLEELEYDYIATGEHVFFHGDCTNAFVTLAACAGATQRIGLLSAATLAPLYPAALLAKMTSDLARISEGRFILGLGMGGEYAEEFHSAGVPLETRGRRYDEALALLDDLFRPDVEQPDSAQTATPPSGPMLQPAPAPDDLKIWIAGRGARAQRRTALSGSGWMPYMYSPDRLRQSIDGIREVAASEGVHWEGHVACVIPASLDNSSTLAYENAVSRLSAQYGTDMSRAVSRYTLTGSPAQVGEQLHAYQEAGLQSVILQPLCAPEEIADCVAAWSTDVLPQFATSPVSQLNHTNQ